MLLYNYNTYTLFYHTPMSIHRILLAKYIIMIIKCICILFLLFSFQYPGNTCIAFITSGHKNYVVETNYFYSLKQSLPLSEINSDSKGCHQRYSCRYFRK